MYINERAPIDFIMRLFRGYSSQDLWAINDFVVRKIRKPLKRFIKKAIKDGYGVPSKLISEEYGNCRTGIHGMKVVNKEIKGRSHKDLRKEWVTILKKIDKAFDLYYETEIKNPTLKYRERDQKEMDEGFLLFGKYLSNLWD
jgi:hypothetical protein